MTGLLTNPIVTIALIVLVSALVLAVIYIYVRAFSQGWKISFWPPAIDPPKVDEIKPDTDAILAMKKSASLQGDLVDKRIEPSKIYLFGYIFVEQDGIEKKILRFKKPNDSYLMSGEHTGTSLEESIDIIVLRTIKENNISQNDLLKAGLSSPVHRSLFRKTEMGMKPTPYIFFKIGLQKEISIPNCSWVYKAIGIADLGDFNEMASSFQLSGVEEDILHIFMKDCVYKQLDLMILECVDVLIFRKNGEQIEFLLIHRNRPTEVKVGSKDTWEYPKGGVNYYETCLEAVYREVLGETGIASNQITFCSYLGWQTVDVSKRKKIYNTLRVHGFTLYYTGKPITNLVSDEGHDDFKWVPLEQAKQEVWMEEDSYAAEFFRRWQSNEEDILRKAGIKKKKQF